MPKFKIRCLVALALLSGAALAQNAMPRQELNPAVNDPSRFAWELFCLVNKPVEGTGMTFWETWPPTNYVYANACQTPVWPKPDPDMRKLTRSRLLHKVSQQAMGASPFNAVTGADAMEETRINRAAFDYIVDNQLWHQEGVLAKATNSGVDFPAASLIVKSNWIQIQPDQQGRYYTVPYQQDGQEILLGLNAFHLVSKDLPNWFWSTFEHVDNPGRCDFIGCQDDFGFAPAYIPPHRNLNQGYPAGDQTRALAELFKKAGLPAVWKNYRLKGTQIDFIDSTGQATLLGNSILEPGFGNASSCMTCHARASVSPDGSGDLTMLLNVNPIMGYVGAPQASWFYQESGPLPLRPMVLFYQLDFLWELTETPARDDCQ